MAHPILCVTGYGGGWGYSGHSIEAIRFSCDCEVLLGGFGLFGGRGEYFGKIRVCLLFFFKQVLHVIVAYTVGRAFPFL